MNGKAVDAEVVEGVNTQTGEVVAMVPAMPQAPEFHGYAGASTLIISDAEAKQLQEVLPEEQHDILPTGEVYVAQVHYRRLLNKVFGAGQWALVPRGEYIRQGKTLCREYALVVRGHFVAEAVGEQDYHENNERSSWATAAEAVKSNALTRCCKDLGIASECWEKRWAETWKAKWAVQVWLKDGGKPQWRRKDAAPFWNEQKADDRKPAKSQKPEPKPEAPKAQQPAGDHPRVTSSQVSELWALCKKTWRLPPNEATERLKEIVLRLCGATSTIDIPADKYAAITEEVVKGGKQ